MSGTPTNLDDRGGWKDGGSLMASVQNDNNGVTKEVIKGPWGFAKVWSLAQFYSVDFLQLRIGVKKCVFNKRIIHLCAYHGLVLCSSGSNAQGESRAPTSARPVTNLIAYFIEEVLLGMIKLVI